MNRIAQRASFRLLLDAIARNIGGNSRTLPANLDRRTLTPMVRRFILFHFPLPSPPRQATRRSGLCFFDVPLRHFFSDFFNSLFGRLKSSYAKGLEVE